MTTRLPLLAALLLFGASITLGGCADTMIKAKEAIGIPKRDQMVARVQDARDSQNDAKTKFTSALDEFLAVTKVDAGQLEATYKSFSAKCDACESAAKKVSSRIADVERVANALFIEWGKEIGQYNSPQLRLQADADLSKTKVQYEKLLASMKAAASKMDKPLLTFKDQVLFLKHKLNARAIAGLEATAKEISSDVQSLITEMNASIEEADRFIKQMQGT